MDYLSSLATTNQNQEGKVDNLTPTLILDIFATAKMNSIRLAKVRDYIISEPEEELLESFLLDDRETFSNMFLDYYKKNNTYINLNNLSTIYEHDPNAEIKRKNHLSVIFYVSGAIDASLFDKAGDLLVISDKELISNAKSALNKAVPGGYQYANTKSIGVYPFSNPLCPQYKLITDKDVIRALAASRGTEVYLLPRILIEDPVVMYLGAKVNNLLVETFIKADKGALVTRAVEYRMVSNS